MKLRNHLAAFINRVTSPPSNSSKQTGRCLVRRFVSLIPRLCCCIWKRFSLSSVLKRTHIRKFLSQLDTVNQIRNLLQPQNYSTTTLKAPGHLNNSSSGFSLGCSLPEPKESKKKHTKKCLEGATYHVATSAAQGGPIQRWTCRNKLI